MTYAGPAFVGYSPEDFLDGTWLLTPWAELAYRRICDWIYKTGDQLEDNDAVMRVITKAGGRWKRIKAELIAAGKIIIEAGHITNRRCQNEIGKAFKRRNKGKLAAESRHESDARSTTRAYQNAAKSDAHEHAPSRVEDSEKSEVSKNASPLTEPHLDKPSSLEARDSEKIDGGFSGDSGSGGRWASQQTRDEFATTACVELLPGKDLGAKWAVAMAAEDPGHPEHAEACRAMRRAAKAGGIGWVSPERRHANGKAA